MRLQILSDLHWESETFFAEPHPQAEALVLAGDVDATWRGLERFKSWPVPVLMVAGNHEFDAREWRDAWPRLRRTCERLGIRLLEQETVELHDDRGRRIRFLGTTRWCDFDLFGPEQRPKAMRAATYFVKVMRATLDGQPFGPEAVREQALRCRAWLSSALAQPATADATVVITHYAPSLRSADPRYGAQPTTASFCNADDDLLQHADLWVHGHLHVRHDYQAGRCRVVCQARGVEKKGETAGFDAHALFCV